MGAREMVERARARGVPDPFSWRVDGSLLASRAGAGGAGPMRAGVAGTRLYAFQVADVYALSREVQSHDAAVAETARYLAITTEQVSACLAYAAAHPEQMRADRVGVYGKEHR
jgi:uncharacterized protein (DUF433 family)